MFKVQFVCDHEDADQIAMLLASLIAVTKTHSLRPFSGNPADSERMGREVIDTLVRTEEIKKTNEWLFAPKIKNVDFLWNGDQELIFRCSMTIKQFLEYGSYLARRKFSLSCSFDGAEHLVEFWPSVYSGEDEEHYKAPILLHTPKKHEEIGHYAYNAGRLRDMAKYVGNSPVGASARRSARRRPSKASKRPHLRLVPPTRPLPIPETPIKTDKSS